MTKVLRRLEDGMVAFLMTGDSAENIFGDLNGVLPDDDLLVLSYFEEDDEILDEPIHVFNMTAACVSVENADEVLDILLSEIAEMERQAIEELRSMVKGFLRKGKTDMD